MAFGLHFDRLVLTLDDAPDVPGAIRCDDVETALVPLCARFLALPGT